MKKYTILFVGFILVGCLISAQQTPVRGSLKDINGNVYKTIKIGNQVWMDENLKATSYNTGTSIPQVKDNTAWKQLKTGAYCWFNNDIRNKSQYGALYNWYVIETGNVCPSGWHVPSDAEWTTLQNYLVANGFNFDETFTGNKIAKSLAAKNRWTPSSSVGAIGNKDFPRKRNVTGFSAVPGGLRYFGDGRFFNIGDQGCLWSSTDEYGSAAWYRNLYFDNVSFDRQNLEKENGFSIRCMKDIPEVIDLNAGLVAWYPFNGNANDASGNGNDGVILGAMLVTDFAGNPDCAYYFQGTDNYLEVPNNPYINFGKTMSFSVSLWLSTTARGTYGLIDKGINDSVIYQIALISGTPYYNFGQDNSIASLYNTTFAENDDSWHLITATADRTTNTLRLYVDGMLTVELVLTSIQDFVMSSSANLKIGLDRNFYYPYNGKLDDVRIYNRVLSSNEVLALYNAAPAITTLKSVSAITENAENNQQILSKSIEMYPNPANSVLYFRNLNSDVLISIYDLQGRKVVSGMIVNNQIDINALTSGVYAVEIKFDNQTIVKKLVKQ